MNPSSLLYKVLQVGTTQLMARAQSGPVELRQLLREAMVIGVLRWEGFVM